MSKAGRFICILAIIASVVVLAGHLISRTGRDVSRLSEDINIDGFAEGIGNAISDIGNSSTLSLKNSTRIFTC